MPTADKPLDTTELLAQIVREDLSELDKVRLLQDNMPESMTPERAVILTSILGQLAQAVSSEDGQAAHGQVQGLMRKMTALMFKPTRPDPVWELPSGSRAAILLELVRAMHAALPNEMSRMQWVTEEATVEAASMLLGGLNEAREQLLAAGAGDVTGLEREVLRPLACDAREFSLRRHLTFARPVWPSTSVPLDPSAVFYSGGQRVRELLAEVCVERALHCLVPARHRESASARWEQLRNSAIAVFDMTEYRNPMPPENAIIVAPVAYELGMALAVGRPAVIVATASQLMPFDVDVDPVRLGVTQHGVGDRGVVADALDSALYGVQRGGAGDSVGPSLEWLRGHYSGADLRMLDVFKPDANADPIRARRLADTAITMLDGAAPDVLLSTWPGAYPDPTQPRCFHVTAFGPPWAGTTRDILNASCGTDVAYVRGDRVPDPNIIRSIWDEIGRATHVVVDLTGFNANVLLELGIAHVLGRNVLLVSQDSPSKQMLPALAKLRCHQYSLTGTNRDELRRTFDQFLFPNRAAPQPPAASAPRRRQASAVA
ncbi:MAG: hypothetical protein ACRDRX_22130, partial [Pseudonocardiaceae bacterium]